MYIANKVNGVGEITGSNETSYFVYFPETDRELSVLKKYATVYQTSEEAANKTEQLQDGGTLDKNINLGASQWLAEKNRENALKNLPSSLR